MENLTAQNWKKLADGEILNLPLFYNVELIKIGELAKTCPYTTKDENLVVRILDVVRLNENAAEVYFQYIQNATGIILGGGYLQATAREIPGDRLSARRSGASRKLWTMVKDSVRSLADLCPSH